MLEKGFKWSQAGVLGARLVFVTDHTCICFCGERALMQADDRPDFRDSPKQGSGGAGFHWVRTRSLWQRAQPKVDTKLSHILGEV